jgi:alpha-L-rhamnosidase
MHRITMKPARILTALSLALVTVTPTMVGAEPSPNTKSSASIAADAPISIKDPRTEGVIQPMGVEEANPRFSWRYEASAQAPRGFTQSAARILVASSPEKLAQGQGDLWDSGKLEGADTLAAIYAGQPLQSATRYYWKVTGLDANGKSYQTEPQFFEMGLLKAEDWNAAQWIGARVERPKTIPANLQGLTDYSFETKLKIVEKRANLLFRAAYAWQKSYGLEILPGAPGKLIVTCNNGEKKAEILKEYPLPDCAANVWHKLEVTLKGADFWFRVNDKAVNDEPLHDDTIKGGSVALGSYSADRKPSVAQFDDFKLTTNGQVLVQENFEDPTMFAFQDRVFSDTFFSRVKDGVMEVSLTSTFLEPKDGLAAPLLRKSFSTEPKKIVRARAYVAGLGYYTFWLNGKRLDDYLLNPGFARYNKTAYYSVYDLTDHLDRDNVLAFELGRGWYGMTTPTLWGETFNNDWMAEPALRTLLTVDYADGTRQVVVSDPSFKTATGPILFDSIKAGEIHDARKELPGWNLVKFADQKWSPAVVAKGTMPSAAPGLTAQMFEPIRVIESLTPVSIEKIEEETGAWLIDFGKNIAGTVEFKLRGEPGQRTRISYHEKITPEWRGRWNNFGAEATGSYQTDVFVAKGGAEETFQARYSYKGFRYIRVEGFKEKPSPNQFTAKVFNSDMADVGEFRSSSELWNKIWEAGKASIRSNMHSIPTDCPQWEKLGWTCDDNGPYYAMAFGFDLRKLYEKRLQDYADDISPDGKIRNTIPSTWAKGDDPAWVGSYVDLTWKHYQTYGDRRMVARHYDNLKLYMTTLIKEGEASEKPPLLTTPRKALGDWVSPDGNIPPEGALIYFDAYFYKYLRVMRDLAERLGRGEDVAYYGKLATDLKREFNVFFYDEAEGGYYGTNRAVGYRQSPNAVALALGLVPADRIQRVVNRLVEDIKVRNGHIWTGILGMEFIADALCENGRSDVAYSAHLKDDYPSIGNMIREGATTLWEDLALKKARSLNHKMYATPLGWMARYVAGLHVEGVPVDGVGFRKAVIAPYPVPDQIKFAKLDYDSPMGRYQSHWKVQDDAIIYDLVIPPNATATARLPLFGKTEVALTESGKTLWENGKPKGSADGCGKVTVENDRLTIPLGSGTYSFAVKPTGTQGKSK